MIYNAIVLVIRSEVWFRDTLHDFVVEFGFDLNVERMLIDVEFYVATFNGMLNHNSTVLAKFNEFINNRYRCTTGPKPAPQSPEDQKVARIIAQVHERKIVRFILSKAFKFLRNFSANQKKAKQDAEKADQVAAELMKLEQLEKKTKAATKGTKAATKAKKGMKTAKKVVVEDGYHTDDTELSANSTVAAMEEDETPSLVQTVQITPMSKAPRLVPSNVQACKIAAWKPPRKAFLMFKWAIVTFPFMFIMNLRKMCKAGKKISVEKFKKNGRR